MLNKVNRKTDGFSLAEVLITLGVIGVVAVMAFINFNKEDYKKTMVTKLKKAYSLTYQAIRSSEGTNSNINTWDFGTPNDENPVLMRNWFLTYLAPYMNYVSITNGSSSIIVKMNDGLDIEFHRGDNIDVLFYLNGYNKSVKIGRDIFFFEIVPDSINDPFRPYDDGATGTGRSKWTTGTYACTETNSIDNRRYCAGLILYDQWELKNDYPFYE